jgi:hypothetical protein
VQYYQSFNEVPAQPYDASTTELQFAWFDRVSDAGFKNDNIHVIDPGTADANVTVSIPGCPAKTLNVPHGGYDLFTCSTGFGGPVMVTSNNGVPVLASQRVQYYQSFNEEWGQAPGSAAAGLQFSWYDHKSSPGFKNDNIHVWDPTGAALSASSLTVSIPGCSPSAYQASSSELIYSCPFGSGFGGPVTITSTGNPVLASQRVQYYQSFNEVPGVSPTLATTLFYFAWYDHISDPGFKNDNIQVWNPSTTTTAMVSYSIPGNPGCSSASPVAVAPGSYAIFNCSTGFGGPVVVSSTGTGILVSQRVQYYSSFNEVLGAGIYS